MSADSNDATPEGPQTILQSSESTAFYMWLLITVSAGIIMAQDSWVGMQQPRLSTVDATAAFTKVMVIHAIWLVVTIGFMVFTWIARPTSAWKIHLVMGTLTVLWTVGVLFWAFSDVERLQVSTWRCESAPTDAVATAEFLESCELTDMGINIRLGGDIFLWSADDEHHWRWIVPGEGLATLQTHWPSETTGMYLSADDDGAPLIRGSEESVPGGNWSARFDPATTRHLRLYFVETTSTAPGDIGTPNPLESIPGGGLLYHERFKFSE